jgi:hypothetical protein
MFSYDQIDHLSGFLTALDIFSQQMLRKGDRMEYLQFTNFSIKLIDVEELGIYFAIMYDHNILKKMEEIVPKIKDILFNNKAMFTHWNGYDCSPFYSLKNPILNEIVMHVYGNEFEMEIY